MLSFMKRPMPERCATSRIAASAASRTCTDWSDSSYLNVPTPTGPALGRTWLPEGGGARNSPSCVSSTIARISTWLLKVESACFFCSPYQDGSPLGSRPSS